MTGTLILIGFPVLLTIFSVFCAARDKKVLFCTVYGACVFCIAGACAFGGALPGAEGQTFTLLSPIIDSIGYDSLGTLSTPPAYLFILKLCSFFGGMPYVFPAVTALIQGILSGIAVYRRCTNPYVGAFVLTVCFLPTLFAGSQTFTAALICLIASEFIEDRRFFRFAGAMLAAACFDVSVLLLIPIYIATLIPEPWALAVVSAAAAALAAIYGDITAGIYAFLGEGMSGTHTQPVVCTVAAIAAALLALLMYAMFVNRGEKYGSNVKVLVFGAAMSAAAVFREELFTVSLFLLIQSAVTLAPEAHAIGRKFTQILFPDSSKTAVIVFDTVCVLLLYGLYIYITVCDIFGTGTFGSALFGEANV